MDKIYDVIILGAGPAGLAAGLYSGRYRLSTLVIEKAKDGGQIAITDEIENYPGQMEAGTIPLPVIIGVKATLKTLHPELTIIARWHCISISFDWERPI